MGSYWHSETESRIRNIADTNLSEEFTNSTNKIFVYVDPEWSRDNDGVKVWLANSGISAEASSIRNGAQMNTETGRRSADNDLLK